MNNCTDILFYSGKGTSPFCVEKTEKSFKEYLGNRSASFISTSDPSYFNDSHLKNIKAVVFPGGPSAMEIYSSFTKDNIKSLQNFKGSYIGFCAGSYLMSPFQYQKTPTSTPFDCKFFQLTHVHLQGPAMTFDQSLGQNFSLSPKTAQAVEIFEDNSSKSYHVFWNGGGYYLSSTYSYFTDRSLAYYKSATGAKGACKENLPAILYSNYNEKIRIGSGVHPEIQLTESEIEEKFPNINNKKELADSIPQQKALFAKICKAAGI